jgi:hypothetical protein
MSTEPEILNAFHAKHLPAGKRKDNLRKGGKGGTASKLALLRTSFLPLG